MIVYRIATKKYSDDLSGAGAALHGGRWNKKGTPVLYTGESKEIALLETLVHTPPMIVPQLDIITLDIPDDSIKTIDVEMLPANWSNYPAPTVLSEIGQQWVIEADTLALKVPSSIIHSAHNILLNCRHIRYSEVKFIDKREFKLDSRLIK
jgi:RES domain-containing protein